MVTDPPQHDSTEGRYPHVFRPIQVGTLSLDHRLVVPPHGGGNGGLMGSEDDFEQHAAMWLAKLAGGMRWLGGGPNYVRNPLPPGFEPTGVGAHGPGFFRDPRYPDRIGELAARVHAGGGLISVQMVLQGGMPIAPSATLSSYADHRIPHALDLDEVHWLVGEYGESAAIAIDAGVDAIEIHANHDDVVQWFLSPLTNRRDDEYGGTAEQRRRFLREIVEAIRGHASRPITLGLRLCLDEMIDGGFGVEECAATVAAFTAEGTVDYFSLDVGNNWGDPSYVPNPWYDDYQWAPMCGQVKAATDRPVVYAGRVLDVAQAEAVLGAGHADIVAMARATMADPDIVAKTRTGGEAQVRPCIGLNECIHRKLVEGLVYACGVSPRFGREAEPEPPPPNATRSLLVVGGGPAGTELAALCAERGHDVTLWERNGYLGGALAVAAMARANRRYQVWIEYQARRLDATGVRVVLGREATPDDVLAADVDVVAVATGAVIAPTRRGRCRAPARRHDHRGADRHGGTRIGRRCGGGGRRTCSSVGGRPPRRPRPPRHAHLPNLWPRSTGREILIRRDVRPPGQRRCDARTADPPDRSERRWTAAGVQLWRAPLVDRGRRPRGAGLRLDPRRWTLPRPQASPPGRPPPR